MILVDCIVLNVFQKWSTSTKDYLGIGNGDEIMWLDTLIMEIKELELMYFDAKWEMERYQRLNHEYLTYGREYLLNKYKSNVTYVYKYLNTSIFKDSVESFKYVKEKFENKQRALELISFFHTDGDLINPRYYTSEEEIAWKKKI